MPDFQIVSDKEGLVAGVSQYGELIVAPIAYSDPHYKSVNVALTPFEVVAGISGRKFVITSMLLASSKTFGTATTAETLTLYEAEASDLSTNLKTLAQIDMLKNDRLVATGLNLITSQGISIVASATDTNVDVTIAGYYVPPL